LFTVRPPSADAVALSVSVAGAVAPVGGVTVRLTDGGDTTVTVTGGVEEEVSPVLSVTRAVTL
jgi:hypothetical protein